MSRFAWGSVYSVSLWLSAALVIAEPLPNETDNPYDRQIDRALAQLADPQPARRATALEQLGFLRAYRAEPACLAALHDTYPSVRRQAAMALAWCGSRNAVAPLLAGLDDHDWLVRQAAHASLSNLTGMEFPFDGLAEAEIRTAQAGGWREWWKAQPAHQAPADVLTLLEGSQNLALGRPVLCSSIYRGPGEVLTDGETSGHFWQTKNVPFPQWCTVDLGTTREISSVVVFQFAPKYCLTDYELTLSDDNVHFRPLVRERRITSPTLELDFPPNQARYVRLTSFGNERKLYPTTLFEIQVFGATPRGAAIARDELLWRQERAARAMGALGGQGVARALIGLLGATPPTAEPSRPMVRAAIRSLGRTRDELAFAYLIRLLDNTMWARAAAEALGDQGDARAVWPLLAAYDRYAKLLDGRDPPSLPADDKMGFPSEDRMLETPFWIAHALCRLPPGTPADRARLRELAPRFVANLPGDHDTYILYQREAGPSLLSHLLERSGLRQEVCEQAFIRLGQTRRLPPPPDATRITWPQLPPYRTSTWLPAACANSADLPRLLALQGHDDHFVRINAAKAIAWLGDRRALEPLAKLLAQAKAEGDFGYNGQFKNEEFDDKAPRWREGLIRAIGLLGGRNQAGLLTQILNDDRSVLEVRHAAAEALADLGTEEALAALADAAAHHPYRTIQHVARDALRCRGADPMDDALTHVAAPHADSPAVTVHGSGQLRESALDAVVFIKGDNDVPNTRYTVEQADRWRQTYAVTDEGPTYRPGENLYVLRPVRPDGKVTPLTRFTEGFVADPEVSFDGRSVVFAHRSAKTPWWHLFQIDVDGRNLKQLTDGPFHDVGPTWLPDGRIAFSSSRSGVRDEYHGYLCTALHVMNANGGDLHPIAMNIGRDNEPTVMADGRIAFSRLEVFYSRNKTELTVHAVRPDGTGDVVLYGPERRQFWRTLDHGEPDPADKQESPLTHRVLRMTQPQPAIDARQLLVSTQAGLALVGARRDAETLLVPDYQQWAYTTPFPLPDGRILCAATEKTPDRKKVDLGLYLFDPRTGQRQLLYNDPRSADYEARPIAGRQRPPIWPEAASRHAYSGRFFCASVFDTQEREVRQRGRYVRLIEGQPVVQRTSTHNGPWEVWKNHGGTLARVLGTAPLASDGSFYAEVPADRLLHLQVLDSDRRVVGNQLTWIYTRPGETKSCVGCHESPHAAPTPGTAMASRQTPLRFLPSGDEFAYRAKAWFKGSLPSEIEERTRTVHAVNLLGR